MKKFKEIYKMGRKMLVITGCKGGLRGKLYVFEFTNGVSRKELQSAANFLEKDGDSSVYRVKEYFGMGNSYASDCETYINKNHRTIWNNNSYDEWHACMLEDGEDEDSLTYDRYYEDCDVYLGDERVNLNVPVDGVIVCFANLGLWDGHHQGAKKFGSNVSNILYSDNDYLDWYCDRYNVRCTGVHHDGTNTYLYRVARDSQHARELVNSIAYEGMTEQEFMRATKSLRPYVAKVYGW